MNWCIGFFVIGAIKAVLAYIGSYGGGAGGYGGTGFGGVFSLGGGYPGFGFPWLAPPLSFQVNTGSTYGYPGGINYYKGPIDQYGFNGIPKVAPEGFVSASQAARIAAGIAANKTFTAIVVAGSRPGVGGGGQASGGAGGGIGVAASLGAFNGRR